MKITQYITLSILLFACHHAQSNAIYNNEIITKDMYLSGTYNTDAVKIVVGQDSVVDLINNREFLRLSHTVGQYCNNTFLAGDSPACTSASEPNHSMALSSEDRWEMGTGYALIDMVDTVASNFFWPGAYGSPPNYNHHYFKADTPEKTNLLGFMSSAMGWAKDGSDTVGDFDLITLGNGVAGAGDEGDYALFTFADAGTKADMDLRWFTFGLNLRTPPHFNNLARDLSNSGFIAHRTFDGEFFSIAPSANIQSVGVSFIGFISSIMFMLTFLAKRSRNAVFKP